MGQNKLEPVGSAMKYLIDYREGKLKQGLGIDCPALDDYFRHKKSQLNIILGHDNVGKTFFIIWYYLCIVLIHKKKVCIWSGENKKGQIMRDLIQMLAGKKFIELSRSEIQQYSNFLEYYFVFVDNKHLYKPKELLEVFNEADCEINLIDPYTGLDRDMTYQGNYEFLNMSRQFVNETGKTIYVNTHPTSESGRTSMLYTEGDWVGQLKPPLRSHIEGGKSFLNRSDDMLIIHRMPSSKTMKYFTLVSTEKIKDVESGGKITPLNEPILAEFNYGLGFKFNGVDPLQKYRITLKSKTIL